MLDRGRTGHNVQSPSASGLSVSEVRGETILSANSPILLCCPMIILNTLSGSFISHLCWLKAQMEVSQKKKNRLRNRMMNHELGGFPPTPPMARLPTWHPLPATPPRRRGTTRTALTEAWQWSRNHHGGLDVDLCTWKNQEILLVKSERSEKCY